MVKEVKIQLVVNVADGVVLVDPEYLKDRRVFGHVLAAFRYGREDLDVLGKICSIFRTCRAEPSYSIGKVDLWPPILRGP